MRFFDLKRRFGIDPLYPISRYVRGFSQTGVPARDDEHEKDDPAHFKPTTYDVTAGGCTNPLFAAALPAAPGDELCRLPAGPRRPGLVYFSVLGGVPNDLVGPDRLDPSGRLRDDAWQAIIGTDYASYQRDGLDPRLVQSITPRAGRPDPSAPDALPNDPDNRTHRDWDTKKRDLQYACSFPLVTAVSKEETLDCQPDSDAPLCASRDQSVVRDQVRARSFPTPRPMQIAHGLGAQATIASLCPSDLSDPTATTYGYRPALDALVDRLKAGLVK